MTDLVFSRVTMLHDVRAMKSEYLINLMHRHKRVYKWNKMPGNTFQTVYSYDKPASSEGGGAT